MSGEIDSGPEYWGDEWKAGWERVSMFLKDKSHFPENTVTSVQTFPGYGHYNGFMPSLTTALNDYIVFGAKNLVSYVGEETYPVHIELRGKNLTDTIYITGNQDALANWEAKGVKMKLISDSIASARPVQVHPRQLGARGHHFKCRRRQPHHSRCRTRQSRVPSVGEKPVDG